MSLKVSERTYIQTQIIQKLCSQLMIVLFKIKSKLATLVES